jgi:hypothetical protein
MEIQFSRCLELNAVPAASEAIELLLVHVGRRVLDSTYGRTDNSARWNTDSRSVDPSPLCVASVGRWRGGLGMGRGGADEQHPGEDR